MAKTCPKCKRLLFTSEFHRDSNRLDGLRVYCKSCAKTDQAKYRKEHKKENNEYQRKWHCKNKKKVLIKRKKWRGKNKEKIQRSDIKWRKENPEKYKLTSRKANKRYRQKNPKRYAARSMVYHAIELGILERPNHCESCEKICFTEAHHHRGYNADHCLDVLWLCKKCHVKKHKIGENRGLSCG